MKKLSSLLRLGLAATCAALLTTPLLATATPRANRAPLDILLTNDDGWRGVGGRDTPLILALRDALEGAGHHVTVVASGTDQSGQGGRITLPPLRLEVANPEPDVWTLTPGSPSDNVFFALSELYGDDQPDLVISGINPGNNLGTAVNHSGTVNAALTGIELGVPAVAMNVGSGASPAVIDDAADYAVDLVSELRRTAKRGELLPDDLALNVCYPVLPAPRGTRQTTLDTAPGLDLDYTRVNGTPGTPGTYSVGIAVPQGKGARGSDVRAIDDGFVSITALESDRDLDRANDRWTDRLVNRLN